MFDIFVSGVLEIIPLLIIVLSIVLKLNKLEKSSAIAVLRIIRTILFIPFILIIVLLTVSLNAYVLMIPILIIASVIVLTKNGIRKVRKKEVVAENIGKEIAIVFVIIYGIIVIFLPKMFESSLAMPITGTVPYMSTKEIEAFNSTFNEYGELQSGAQVKELLNKLIRNANTYASEPYKIPIVSYNSNGDSNDPNFIMDKTFCEVKDKNNINTYLEYVNNMGERVDLEHTYNVICFSDVHGLIRGITINYDQNSNEINFTYDGTHGECIAIEGLNSVE